MATKVFTVDSELRRYWVSRTQFGGAVWFTAEYQPFRRGTKVPWQASRVLVRNANACVRISCYPNEPLAELSDTPFAGDWSDGGRFGQLNRAVYRTEDDARRVVMDEVERDNRRAAKWMRTIGGYRVWVETDPIPRRSNNHGVRWRIYVGGKLEGKGESAHEQAAREHAWEAAESLIATRGGKANG
jgi:hypothetical protein